MTNARFSMELIDGFAWGDLLIPILFLFLYHALHFKPDLLTQTITNISRTHIVNNNLKIDRSSMKTKSPFLLHRSFDRSLNRSHKWIIFREEFSDNNSCRSIDQ